MPKQLYELWSWQWWLWALAMLIGVCSLALTLWAVLRRDTPRQTLFRWFVFWSLTPALWCTLEYHNMFMSLPSSRTSGEAFEHFKYGQEIGTKFWIAMVAILTARLTLEHLRRRKTDCSKKTEEKPNQPDASDGK